MSDNKESDDILITSCEMDIRSKEEDLMKGEINEDINFFGSRGGGEYP